MKIAVTAEGPSMDSRVDSRFGRCPYYVVVETDDGSFESLENVNAEHGSGAGIQAGRMMSDRSVEYVLTGNCGPNAYRTLDAAGVKVITGCDGTVADITRRFVEGQLRPTGGPNVDSHHGLG